MTTETPPNWVLLEAAKQAHLEGRSIEVLRGEYRYCISFRALCDMIQKHEKPPVDRKLLCAREAVKPFEDKSRGSVGGYISIDLLEPYVVYAIELWEEGFGK
jgi:hypothetical protein